MADQTTLKGSSGFSANAAGASGPGSNGADCGPTRSPRGNPVDSGPSGVVHNVTGFGEDLLYIGRAPSTLNRNRASPESRLCKRRRCDLDGRGPAGRFQHAGTYRRRCRGLGIGTGNEPRRRSSERGLGDDGDCGFVYRGRPPLVAKEALRLSAGQRGIHAERELGANRSASKRSVAQASVRFYGLTRRPPPDCLFAA